MQDRQFAPVFPGRVRNLAGKTAAEQVQLGGGSAAVPALKNHKIWDYVHYGFWYSIGSKMAIQQRLSPVNRLSKTDTKGSTDYADYTDFSGKFALKSVDRILNLLTLKTFPKTTGFWDGPADTDSGASSEKCPKDDGWIIP
jgi:hypothetical protein